MEASYLSVQNLTNTSTVHYEVLIIIIIITHMWLELLTTIILITYMEFPPYNLKHKLHMSKELTSSLKMANG